MPRGAGGSGGSGESGRSAESGGTFPTFPTLQTTGSLSCNRRGSNRADREHHAETDDDQRGDQHPDGTDVVKEAGLPEGEAGANHQNEITDQVQVDELHAAYLCKFTTRAARRLSRRVSSRELSYFGRSSP